MKVPQLTVTRAANGLFIAPSAASELYQGGPWVADTVAQGLARIGMEMFGEKSQRNEGSRSMGLIDETHAVGVLLFFGAPSYVSKALGFTPEAAKVAPSSLSEPVPGTFVERFREATKPVVDAIAAQAIPAPEEDFDFAPPPPISTKPLPEEKS